MIAEYDPSDSAQVALLNAASAGVNRVYPRTVLDPTQIGVNGPIAIDEQPIELLSRDTDAAPELAGFCKRPGSGSATVP